MAIFNAITPEDDAAIIRALSCDPESGSITRRSISRSRNPASRSGRQAGHKDARGYIEVGVNGKRYKAHRLVWFFANGSWPVGVIDHINGDRSDNRIVNLRDVSQQENVHNVGTIGRQTKTGIMGVVQMENGMFRPEIQVGESRISLGTFATIEEASASYLTAKRLLHKGFISDRRLPL